MTTATLNLILEIVGTFAPLLALTAVIPFAGLIFGDDDFKKGLMPLIISGAIAVLFSATLVATKWTNINLEYGNALINLYLISAVISAVTYYRLRAFRNNYHDHIEETYDVLEFFIAYHFYWLTTSLKNMMPEKATIHRTGKVLINGITKNSWSNGNSVDSTLDVPNAPTPIEKFKVKERELQQTE